MHFDLVCGCVRARHSQKRLQVLMSITAAAGRPVVHGSKKEYSTTKAYLVEYKYLVTNMGFFRRFGGGEKWKERKALRTPFSFTSFLQWGCHLASKGGTVMDAACAAI